jgi:hypothetical protein
MDRLITYVNAIHGHPAPVAIVERSTARDGWHDQGYDVHREDTEYVFDNGVVIRRSVEVDEFPADLACAECWITYEVVRHGAAQRVAPATQRFDNPCREAFWLRYHSESPV